MGEARHVDLQIFKFCRKKKLFYVNNFGKDYRDFTYVGDVISMLKLLVKKEANLKIMIFLIFVQINLLKQKK